VLAAHDSGDLAAAVAGGHDTFKKWINSVGKAQKRKGKRLFMPMRVALTVCGLGRAVGDGAAQTVLCLLVPTPFIYKQQQELACK
jgi:glutamyl-tRNA synthetase